MRREWPEETWVVGEVDEGVGWDGREELGVVDNDGDEESGNELDGVGIGLEIGV